jgi:asparagine synthase (glutamine-hydrolysing)
VDELPCTIANLRLYPTPWTAFRGIRKLRQPAHWFGKAAVARSGDIGTCVSPQAGDLEEEAVEELLLRLREATCIRLMSEVPLGAFLSGGLDSSAVVALMAEEMSEPVKTFSIGFTDETFNELPYARLVAERYQTEHMNSPSPQTPGSCPELVWAFGEPFADSSALPSYYLSKLARQHVTVALNGDGCDELFAGYERYQATRFASAYSRLPVWLRENAVRELAGRLPEGTGYRDPFRRLKRFLDSTEASPERRYARWITLFNNLEKEQLYTPEYRLQAGGIDSIALIEEAYAKADSPDFVERTQLADIETYLTGDLLVKADIAGMMNSLEPRTPFLDHELAEWVSRLPPRMKLRGRVSKAILRQAFRERLPEAVLRRRKQGFGAPVGAWFRGELKPVGEAILLSTRTEQRGFLHVPALQKLFDEHASGRVNNGFRLWQLLCLELWFRTYVDRPRSDLTDPVSGLFG